MTSKTIKSAYSRRVRGPQIKDGKVVSVGRRVARGSAGTKTDDATRARRMEDEARRQGELLEKADMDVFFDVDDWTTGFDGGGDWEDIEPATK